jgi:hypothetical protein
MTPLQQIFQSWIKSRESLFSIDFEISLNGSILIQLHINKGLFCEENLKSKVWKDRPLPLPPGPNVIKLFCR